MFIEIDSIIIEIPWIRIGIDLLVSKKRINRLITIQYWCKKVENKIEWAIPQKKIVV